MVDLIMTPAQNRRLMKKARRRIQRYRITGNNQARVRSADEGAGKLFDYIVKHNPDGSPKDTLRFKLDAANRLRLVHEPTTSVTT